MCFFSKFFLRKSLTDEMFPKFLTLIIYIFSTKLQPSIQSADSCNKKPSPCFTCFPLSHFDPNTFDVLVIMTTISVSLQKNTNRESRRRQLHQNHSKFLQGVTQSNDVTTIHTKNVHVKPSRRNIRRKKNGSRISST
jgi:hypothetical protein